MNWYLTDKSNLLYQIYFTKFFVYISVTKTCLIQLCLFDIYSRIVLEEMVSPPYLCMYHHQVIYLLRSEYIYWVLSLGATIMIFKRWIAIFQILWFSTLASVIRQKVPVNSDTVKSGCLLVVTKFVTLGVLSLFKLFNRYLVFSSVYFESKINFL